MYSKAYAVSYRGTTLPFSATSEIHLTKLLQYNVEENIPACASDGRIEASSGARMAEGPGKPVGELSMSLQSAPSVATSWSGVCTPLGGGGVVPSGAGSSGVCTPLSGGGVVPRGAGSSGVCTPLSGGGVVPSGAGSWGVCTPLSGGGVVPRGAGSSGRPAGDASGVGGATGGCTEGLGVSGCTELGDGPWGGESKGSESLNP